MPRYSIAVVSAAVWALGPAVKAAGAVQQWVPIDREVP